MRKREVLNSGKRRHHATGAAGRGGAERGRPQMMTRFDLSPPSFYRRRRPRPADGEARQNPLATTPTKEPPMRLTEFKALTFDCYGTLIDWESGMIRAMQPLTSGLSRRLARDQILEAHARLESSQQTQTPTKKYREILAVVYRRLAE